MSTPARAPSGRVCGRRNDLDDLLSLLHPCSIPALGCCETRSVRRTRSYVGSGGAREGGQAQPFARRSPTAHDCLLTSHLPYGSLCLQELSRMSSSPSEAAAAPTASPPDATAAASSSSSSLEDELASGAARLTLDAAAAAFDGGLSHMDEVEPRLWIGDVVAATDAALLAANGVRHVVSVVRGSVDLPSVSPTRTLPFASPRLDADRPSASLAAGCRRPHHPGRRR